MLAPMITLLTCQQRLPAPAKICGKIIRGKKPSACILKYPKMYKSWESHQQQVRKNALAEQNNAHKGVYDQWRE
jgi:hypothetical protein